MICNTIGMTVDSFTSIYMTGGAEVEEVYGAIGYGEPIYAKIREIAGIPPLYFTSRTAGSLTDYRIYGETIQDGTPSPDYPVDIVGVGERTENLFDKDATDNYGYYNGNTGEYVNDRSRRHWRIPVSPGDKIYISANQQGLGAFFKNGEYVSPFVGGNFIVPEDVDEASNNFMARDSAQAVITKNHPITEYIPYGYKIPVTVSNGTDTITTPVYIGNEPLHRIGEYADYVDFANGKIVRNVKKIMLTVDNLTMMWIGNLYFYVTNPKTNHICFSSHFVSSKNKGIYVTSEVRQLVIWMNSFPPGVYNRATFDSYLAAQRAAGTPVTVWYVLETPIEEDPPVPFPALPTLSGTNTMSVDTTVKPSQMHIKGKIKPDGYGRLVDKNGVYILDKDGVQLTVHGQTDTPNT